MNPPPDSEIWPEFKLHIKILGSLVAVLWAVQILNQELSYKLFRFGIIPRTWVGLRGIVFAPFLHGDFSHLLANTVPLVLLGWLILLRGWQQFALVNGIVMVVGGIGTWLLGSANSIHIGASGIVFGYFGFLLLRGFFERSVSAVSLSVLVAVFYSSILLGVLPNQPGISWESHLFGLIGGVLAARFLPRRRKT